jgi:hypothetical protein
LAIERFCVISGNRRTVKEAELLGVIDEIELLHAEARERECILI